MKDESISLQEMLPSSASREQATNAENGVKREADLRNGLDEIELSQDGIPEQDEGRTLQQQQAQTTEDRDVRERTDGEEGEDDGPADLDTPALTLLALQQVSSSFSYRAAEFAYPLYFVVLFTETLLPASLYGFITTASAILLSGTVGELTDRFNTHRLRLVRAFILSQKVLVCATYGLFLLVFYDDDLRTAALHGGKGANPSSDGSSSASARVWSVFATITLIGCLLILSNVGVSVSIERDWVASIADGSLPRLVRLNAIMRRIDLLCKLLAPLFVSLLTSTAGYALSAVILLAISSATTLFELIFIGIVFRRFSVLAQEEERNRHQRQSQQDERHEGERIPPQRQFSTDGIQGWIRWVGSTCRDWLRSQVSDWKTFIVMPVFLSSVAIALLYMSVLSFDSTFIAYLKSETTYSDAFIGGMRGVCVVAGLLGTFLSPLLTRKIGLVRTGTWSLWAELLPLTLSLVSLYVGIESRSRPAWNTALLFTGLALSRIGLWSFDLAQLAQVQLAIRSHSRRNALMGLQFALQNTLDLFHYALTIIWSKPSQFRNAADVSFAAIGFATLLYTFVYARRERGHLLHLDKMSLESLLGRKAR